mmetsp:Transcript_29828/g.69719  ORF Transcript_29828/g.69719 Transcript_29828/m.69719 type:complete len:228 (+) Transcript_29828:3392-4075(+)
MNEYSVPAEVAEVQKLYSDAKLVLSTLAAPDSAESKLGQAELLAMHKLGWLDPFSVFESTVASVLRSGQTVEEATTKLEAANCLPPKRMGEVLMRKLLEWWQAEVGGAEKLSADADALKMYGKTLLTKKGLMMKFIAGESVAQHSAQLGALCAVQAFCDALNYPHELLQNLFAMFYTIDVVTEEGCTAWREDEDEAVKNKTKALIKLSAFFTKLQEEEEGEGEEDDE